MIRTKCEVLSVRRTGVYHSLTLVAPEIAEAARPGQFVQIGVPEGRDILLRRPFSIHQASRRGGWAGTLEVVFDVVGPGTQWLSTTKAHDTLDVIGPLGRAFQYPKDDRISCLLVGGGYGAAPLHFLAEELRGREKVVNMLVGARSDDRVFKPIEAKRLAASVWITTEDGTMGDQGIVTDLLPDLLERTGAEAVYACGPNPMLRAVAAVTMERKIPCQVAIEEQMGCGIGVCWSCVVPLLAADGQGWWNVRTCMEGPVFNAARIWWGRWLGGTEETTTPTEPPKAHEVAEAWRS